MHRSLNMPIYRIDQEILLNIAFSIRRGIECERVEKRKRKNEYMCRHTTRLSASNADGLTL